MKKFNQFSLLMTLIFCLVFFKGNSQEKTGSDSLSNIKSGALPVPEKEKKVRKNSIMINLSNPMLVSSQFQTIGYERVLPNNQSFTVNVGKFSIPKFRGDLGDSLGLNTDYKDKGFHFSTDYRFYLKKENKYAAPRGVYLAPFYTYNYLNRENSWNIENDGVIEKVYTDLTLNIHTIGAELGYQFIFWDRVALDLILMGPGFGFYSVKAELGTDMDPDKQSEFFDKLNQILADRIPGYDKVIEPGEFSKDGTYNTEGIGFRYLIRVGYRF
jgi:hypothetical protein